MTTPAAALSDHVVILNINEKAGRIIDEIALGSADKPPDIALLVQDERLWRSHPDWHPNPDVRFRMDTVAGCPAEAASLERVWIDRARAAVILADPRRRPLADAHSTLVAMAVERRAPHVHTVMELIASVNRIHLRSTEVNEVVCLGELTEMLVAQSCIAPGIARVYASLLRAHPDTAQVFLCDLPPVSEPVTYRQLVRRIIEARAPVVVCGFVRDTHSSDTGPGTPRRTLVLNPRSSSEPGKDTVLENGDRLVVIAYRRPDPATWGIASAATEADRAATFIRR